MPYMKNAPEGHEHHEDVLRRLHKQMRKDAMPVIRTKEQALRFVKQMYLSGHAFHVTDTMGYLVDRDYIEDSLTMWRACHLIVWKKRQRPTGHVRQ